MEDLLCGLACVLEGLVSVIGVTKLQQLETGTNFNEKRAKISRQTLGI